MTNYELRLNCTNCGQFTKYSQEKKTADGGAIVTCDDCGKRHSDESVMMVDLHQTYPRDESGELLDEVTVK